MKAKNIKMKIDYNRCSTIEEVTEPSNTQEQIKQFQIPVSISIIIKVPQLFPSMFYLHHPELSQQHP